MLRRDSHAAIWVDLTDRGDRWVAMSQADEVLQRLMAWSTELTCVLAIITGVLLRVSGHHAAGLALIGAGVGGLCGRSAVRWLNRRARPEQAGRASREQ